MKCVYNVAMLAFKLQLSDVYDLCVECNDGCATCSDASTCDSCEDYYALEGSSCSGQFMTNDTRHIASSRIF